MKYLLMIALASIALMGCREDRHEARKISSPDINAESVFLTHDHAGNPVVAWTEKSVGQLSLSFAVSSDDGSTFGEKITVPLDADVTTQPESMPKVAFKKDGTIIVAYEKKLPTKENKYAASIHYTASKDRGRSWSPEAYIHGDTIPGKSRSYFDIETLADGEVGAAWLDIKLNNETGGRSVRFAKTNASNAFTHEILVDSSACQCCRIDVYTDVTKNVHVAYRGLRSGKMSQTIRDMMIATSTDQGNRFTKPLTISVDNWNIDGCPHTGPSLCSNNTGLITLWYTEGSGNGIYYTHRTDADEAFRPRELVSNAGRHPQVSANADRIAMLWEENIHINDKPLTNIHYRIISDGTDLEKDILTPEDVNAFFPVVTPLNDGFLVAYLMEVGGVVGVYVRGL